MAFVQIGRRIINVDAIEEIYVYEEGESFGEDDGKHLSERTLFVTLVSGVQTFFTRAAAELLLEEIEVSKKLSGGSSIRLKDILVEGKKNGQGEKGSGDIVINADTWQRFRAAYLDVLREVENTTIGGEEGER